MKKINKIKKPLLFALALLPIAIVGGIFTCLYQFDLYPAEIMDQAIAQLGSRDILVVITVAQTVMYALVCGFFGCLLARAVGLDKPFGFARRPVLIALAVSVVMGIIFSLDYWTFGAVIPGIRESTAAGLSVSAIIASVLYGGIIEEVMLRLFFMSLIAFIIRKLFFRKSETVPEGVLIAANVIAALLFAAGHLPATVVTFGGLTPLLLVRCFLLNGGFALVFGRLYRRHGIQYAMLAHALVHIVCKAILFALV